MKLEQNKDGDDWVIRIRGELDLQNADQLAAAIADAPQGGCVVVDLGGVQFMDSVGLRVLLSAHSASQRDGSRLRLRRGPPSVQRVFEITGTESLLPFE